MVITMQWLPWRGSSTVGWPELSCYCLLLVTQSTPGYVSTFKGNIVQFAMAFS